jgi:hypothetical protein
LGDQLAPVGAAIDFSRKALRCGRTCGRGLQPAGRAFGDRRSSRRWWPPRPVGLVAAGDTERCVHVRVASRRCVGDSCAFLAVRVVPRACRVTWVSLRA